MIVDDEISILEQVKYILKKEDFEVVTADNNRRAFEIMDYDNDFNLILIGTHLPNSNIPAFFSMKPESKRDIDTSTEDNFLKKPFTEEELLNFIKNRI